jgi:hypothetical protein
VLTAVAGFWIVGSLGGLAFLHEPKSPLVTLTALYAMLFLLACSVIAGAVAAADLARRIRYDRRSARISALAPVTEAGSAVHDVIGYHRAA